MISKINSITILRLFENKCLAIHFYNYNNSTPYSTIQSIICILGLISEIFHLNLIIYASLCEILLDHQFDFPLQTIYKELIHLVSALILHSYLYLYGFQISIFGFIIAMQMIIQLVFLFKWQDDKRMLNEMTSKL